MHRLGMAHAGLLCNILKMVSISVYTLEVYDCIISTKQSKYSNFTVNPSNLAVRYDPFEISWGDMLLLSLSNTFNSLLWSGLYTIINTCDPMQNADILWSGQDLLDLDKMWLEWHNPILTLILKNYTYMCSYLNFVSISDICTCSYIICIKRVLSS